MPTVADKLREGARKLAGVDGRAEAEILLGHALGRSRAWLAAHVEADVGAAEGAAYRGLLVRRARGEPVAYLVGSRGFHAIELRVTPDVLIPRPETELLVDLALQRIPPDATCALADLGTGSGAIALAVAHARPRARLLATDASSEALDVARGNAERLGLRNVQFALGDWYAAVGCTKFDGIVANPPYVVESDPHLECGDLRFEPRNALASGVDGLDAIRTLVDGAQAHLHASGWLLLEHGFDQGTAVRRLLAAAGHAGIFTARDLGGRERVSGGCVG